MIGSRLSLMLALIKRLQLAVVLLLLFSAHPSAIWAQEQEAGDALALTADEAYLEVLRWASGSTSDSYLKNLYQSIERAAYRYNIEPEFALAVISAEANYGTRISWARYESWSILESKTGRKMPKLPSVLDDIDLALSELRVIMSRSSTVNQVYTEYWCGPDQQRNTESLDDFSQAVSKLWNGLEPYVRQRRLNEDRNKYQPDYWDSGSPPRAGLPLSTTNGFNSSLGPILRDPSQLKIYGSEELDYLSVAKHYNSRLSDEEAIIIVRSVLTYCEQTDWLVDPRLIMALVSAESAFKPHAVSRVGAIGLGQLMPATAKSLGIDQPFDPIQNLYGCIRYVEREMHRWGNHQNWLDLVLASYNAGAGAVQKYDGIPPYRETQAFVKTVKKRYFRLAPDMQNRN